LGMLYLHWSQRTQWFFRTLFWKDISHPKGIGFVFHRAGRATWMQSLRFWVQGLKRWFIFGFITKTKVSFTSGFGQRRSALYNGNLGRLGWGTKPNITRWALHPSKKGLICNSGSCDLFIGYSCVYFTRGTVEDLLKKKWTPACHA
jgi:hypothetical protein